jgi:hypothetical protein
MCRDVEVFVSQERQILVDRHAARLRTIQNLNWTVEDSLHNQLAVLRARMFR